MAREMRHVPQVHLGRDLFPACTIEEAVLRTIAEAPDHTWTPSETRERIPDGWPTGDNAEVEHALEDLARCRYIWDVDGGYQLAPPS